MATFFAPTPQYKAPSFQELAAPLEIYRQAYNSMEEKYDAQKEKAAMLQAMLGTDPDNELSQYMADYNALMDQTARGFSNGSLPYAQLYSNYQKLRDIWNDKGLKATAAIDAYTKYREAKSKTPGAIGPEYSLTDFLKNPQRAYTFFNPEDIYKAGALTGSAYAQQRGPRNGRAIDNGRWIDEYGPTNEEISGAFSDSNNPFYADASNIMQQYGMDGMDENSRNVFMNAYQRGLASAQKFAVSNNVDYLTKYQRYQMAKQDRAEKKQGRLENMWKEAIEKNPPKKDSKRVVKRSGYKKYYPEGSNEGYDIYSWNWGTETEPHWTPIYFDAEGNYYLLDEKALEKVGGNSEESESGGNPFKVEWPVENDSVPTT